MTQMAQRPSSGLEVPSAQLGLMTPTPDFYQIQKLTPKESERLARWASSNYHKMKQDRSRAERQWYLNMAFYYGRQNVVQTPVTGFGTRLTIPPAPPWRVRTVINRIKPMIRKELAKLTSQRPSASVIPASSEDEDLMAAQAGEQIWESMYFGKDLKTEISQAIWWMLICGDSYLKTYWDPGKFDKINNVMGDICYSAVTPFHVLVPDLREPKLENQPFLIHSSTWTPEHVMMRFKKSLDGSIVKPNTHQANEIIDDGFLNLTTTTAQDNNAVLVHETWIKPGVHPDFPNGALFTTTEDQVLQAYEAFPYDHGEFAFAKFSHIPTGKYYSDSTIVDLIPVQREYNRTRSQIIEAKNKMSKPQLTAPVGSIVASRITTEPGQIIYYKPGFTPPTPLPLQSLPNYVLNEVQQLQLDMDDISGQHEVSRGNAPAGVTAATAISYLQEQDDSQLSHTYDSIESALEKVARHTLWNVSEYWDTPRIVKVTGVDGSFDALMFKGSDIKSNTDIRIEAGSALPTSKAARQALVMDLMKMGFIDPAKGLEVMEIGGVTQLYENVKIDQAQARRENLKMRTLDSETITQVAQQSTVEIDPITGQPMIDPMTGQPMPKMDQNGRPVTPEPAIPVNTWDNHAIHIDIHNAFRKGQAYEQLTPEQQLLFELHVTKHMEAIAAPHIGGRPTSEMMIGLAEAQREQPLPSDMSSPMPGLPEQEQISGSENPGPEPMPEMSEETPQ